MYKSLLGTEFTQTTKRNTKRSNTPSKASFESKLSSIERKVRKVLGHYEKDILVINDYSTYVNYINIAIMKGIVAIDTETDNTLDTIEGRIMGLCLYVPGEKQVYVPINHCDYKTEIRWKWQLTEEQIGEQLKRLVDEKNYLVFHNGKFDSEVLETNCRLRLPVNWDTEIGARILNENEPANLKKQYILHIDKNQERYSIDKLFEKERYAYFDPSLFALYAAPDPYMTYKLYEYQKQEFEKEGNEKLYRLFLDIEMPCLEVLQDMEYNGIEIDLGYCERLAKKYHKLFEQLEKEIETEFAKYSNDIAKWRLTKEANAKEKNSNGKGFKKSKSEKLSDPIKYSSHEQLSIFFYDILKVDIVNKDKPRATGKDEINSIYENTRLPICNLLLQYSKMSKLLDAFIDPLPQMVKKSTGRIHCNFNQIGADTGRQSCSNPNVQQVPSRSKEIRLMFKAGDKVENNEIVDNYYLIHLEDDVLTDNGWKNISELIAGDILLGDDNKEIVKEIVKENNDYKVYV